MPRRIFFILALTSLSALSACGKSGSTSSDDGLFPYREGAAWDYSIWYNVPGGDVKKAVVHSVVEGFQTINGRQYVRIVCTPENLRDNTPDVFYSRSAPEGVYRLDEKYRDFGEYLEVPRPLQIGATWTMNSPTATLNCRYDSNQDITLTDKQVYPRCYLISFDGHPRQTPDQVIGGTTYRLPGIGDITSTRRTRVGSDYYTIHQELIRYRAPGSSEFVKRPSSTTAPALPSTFGSK